MNVALPSIKTDLGFNDSTLAWVVNGYMLTFGGFLLLGGWLGDLFGHRRLFLIGLAVFTLASPGLRPVAAARPSWSPPGRCRGWAAPWSPPWPCR